jgi:hypothetical protein
MGRAKEEETAEAAIKKSLTLLMALSAKGLIQSLLLLMRRKSAITWD